MSVSLLIFLITIQVIIFGGLIYILRRIFTRNVVYATKHLEDLSQDFNQKQEEIRKKSEEAERLYHEKLNAAQDEANKSKIQVIKEAQEERDRIIQQARRQSEELIKQADKTAQLIIGELNERIDKEAIVKASELLKRALPSGIKQATHERLVNEFIESGIAGLDKIQIPEEVTQVIVVSAFNLTKDQIQSLQDKLKKKIKGQLQIKEELDDNLVAGVLLKFGSLVVDGSLSYKIQEEARIKISSLNK